MIVTGLHGDVFDLEQKPFSSGGEGDIFGIKGNGDNVVKIYHKDRVTTELEEKIKYMTEKQPSRNVINQVAWPLDAVYDQPGIFCGFFMPRLNIDISLSEVYKYPPKTSITYQQKIIIAENICAVISAVHEAGYVFGDFNPLNIGVNVTTGNVAFLDTDSYHIVLGDQRAYRCKVCLDGYVAPELLKKCESYKKDAYANAPLPTFTKETDNFALAIHIFKLLMNGFTPFNGIKETDSISTGSPGQGNQAIKRDSYCFKPGNKPQAVAVPPLDVLPEEIADLFTRAFMFGKLDPSQRPSAREWHKALSDYASDLIGCARNPIHMYRKGLSTCPWCEADERYANATAPSLKQISFTNVPNPVVAPVVAPSSPSGSTVINNGNSYSTSATSAIKSGIVRAGKWFAGLQRQTKIALCSSVGALILIALLIGVFNNIIIPNAKYNSAQKLLEAEQYSEAYNAFIELEGFEDSVAMANKAKQLENDSTHYNKAISLLNENNKEKALEEFQQANGYKDTDEQIASITETINSEKYEQAEQLFSDGNYEEAIKIYNEIVQYRDSKDKISSATDSINKGKYAEAESFFSEERYDEAINAFSQIKDYSDSRDRIAQIEDIKLENKYNEAERCRENGEYDKAVEIYKALDTYKDSSDKYMRSMYDYAVSNKTAEDVQTQKYLMELKKVGYEDSQAIYDSLFYYTIDIIVNNSQDDISTNMTECDNNNDIYLHYNLHFTGDESLVGETDHTVHYEIWGYAREGFGSIENVRTGWNWIRQKMGDGRGAADLIFKLSLDNNPKIFERDLVIYWVDGYTGERRYD